VSRLRRIPPAVWILGPLAAAALLAWPLGGWDTVRLQSRELPQLEPGDVLTTHRFAIEVGDAWLTRTGHPAGYSEPEPGEVYLVVPVRVENLTSDPASAAEFGGYLEPAVDGLDHDGWVPVDYVLAADGTVSPELNPGLARDLRLVWTVRSAVLSSGDELRIDLFDAVPHKSLLAYGLRWDFEPAATLITRVVER